jgi:hypothetical protein
MVFYTFVRKYYIYQVQVLAREFIFSFQFEWMNEYLFLVQKKNEVLEFLRGWYKIANIIYDPPNPWIDVFSELYLSKDPQVHHYFLVFEIVWVNQFSPSAKKSIGY